MGRKKDWKAGLMWLIGPKNMAKVINGNYHTSKQKFSGIKEWLDDDKS